MKPSAESQQSASVTCLLNRFVAGEPEAANKLPPQIYAELRKIAVRHMRAERRNHTLQPTALVNEAYLRLVDQPHVSCQDRAHFFAIAARLMRQILVDHARSQQAEKRGGDFKQITLDEPLMGAGSSAAEVLVIHDLLERLARIDARQSQIVELHFFSGLSFEEIALVLNLSLRTVKRDWSMARAWLRVQLAAKP